MKLNFGTITITVSKEDLEKALLERGYILKDKMGPQERADFTQARKFIRGIASQTFVGGEAMTVKEALLILIPKCIQHARAQAEDLSLSNRAIEARIRTADLYNYLETAQENILLSQLGSSIQLGKYLSTMAEKSPLIDKVIHSGYRLYQWNPFLLKWIDQGRDVNDIPSDQRTEEQKLQLQYYREQYGFER